MNIEFLPTAHLDLRETVDFYKQHSPAVKKAFESEFTDAIEIIQSFPLASRLVGPSVRKFVLRKFPHLIIYNVYPDKIVIAAIAHQHRHPRTYLR